MSTIQEPPPRPGAPPEAPEPPDPRVAEQLAGMRHDLREQGDRIRGAQSAFAIFAVMALIIATASLLAVAFKLQKEPRTVTVATPAAAPAAGAAAATPLSRNVDVTLAQFAVTPTATAAPAGRVTFRVHNAGTITHEFVVIRTGHAAADLPVKNGRADESGNVGETGDLAAGASKSVTLNLAAGHYALICNLPGHYLAGQHSDFTIRRG
jgi:uncharacterized cupredoxin-like copper-binding protein